MPVILDYSHGKNDLPSPLRDRVFGYIILAVAVTSLLGFSLAVLTSTLSEVK